MSESAPSAPTRRAVLDLLKRNGPQTVAQLGAALRKSGAGVRRHLEELEQLGLVQQTSRSQGRGRPAYVYALTEMGHDLFPRNYHQLVAQLLEAAATELGPSAVERLFNHRQQELAECRQTGEDRWLVSEHNCAIARVAGTWPTACNHELALFRQLAGPGVAVERVAHIQSGAPVCAYVLRAANGDGAGPGAPQAEATDQAIPGEP